MIAIKIEPCKCSISKAIPHIKGAHDGLHSTFKKGYTHVVNEFISYYFVDYIDETHYFIHLVSPELDKLLAKTHN